MEALTNLSMERCASARSRDTWPIMMRSSAGVVKELLRFAGDVGGIGWVKQVPVFPILDEGGNVPDI